MSRQITLLTSHKGVDLHAATALRVMRDRLEGGDRLEGLFRCEMHTFWAGENGPTMERLLEVGRYFNPNKHHYGHFEVAADGPWGRDGAAAGGGPLPPAWPGTAAGSDLDLDAGGLYDRLLGGAAPAGRTAVDVAAFARGQEGPLLSGVLWRLVLRADPDSAAALGETLAVARGRKQGLLVNPHMEAWLTAVRQEQR